MHVYIYIHIVPTGWKHGWNQKHVAKAIPEPDQSYGKKTPEGSWEGERSEHTSAESEVGAKVV